MSSDTHATEQDSVFVHGSEHGPAGLPHATLKGYLTGFFLSVGLTIVPFWLVMGDVLDSTTLTIVLILGFGIVQIFVHVIYFLHMNSQSEGGWNLMALAFTMVLVVIVLMGSVWIMYSANSNMMPMSPEFSDQGHGHEPAMQYPSRNNDLPSPVQERGHSGH